MATKQELSFEAQFHEADAWPKQYHQLSPTTAKAQQPMIAGFHCQLILRRFEVTEAQRRRKSKSSQNTKIQ